MILAQRFGRVLAILLICFSAVAADAKSTTSSSREREREREEEEAAERKKKSAAVKSRTAPAKSTVKSTKTTAKKAVVSRPSSSRSSKTVSRKSSISEKSRSTASRRTVSEKPKASIVKVSTPARSGSESLYNEKTAKKLDVSKLSFFGPFASRYRYDSRMIRAAEIAAARAHAHSHGSCWRYVKDAMVSAGLIDSRPKTAYAKEASAELTEDYGFKRISVSDPYKAPVGSVLVYGGRGAGHVEFRTRQGFVSDFTSARPSKRPLIGVYVKP